jgi:hypothetical protein
MASIYKRTRPELAIKYLGEKNLGRCYNGFYYMVTSTRRVSEAQITGLRDLHFFTGGQQFGVNSQCDGKEEPAGIDIVKCVDEKTGEPATSPYTGKLYPDREEPYYEYMIEVRVDSSD